MGCAVLRRAAGRQVPPLGWTGMDYSAELASAVGTAEDKFSTYAAGDVARAAIDAIAAEAKIAASKFTSDESTIRTAAETARAKMRQWQVKRLSEILEREE